MNPTELLDKIKDLIANQDLDTAKKFFEDHKDDFGEYLEQAKKLLENAGDAGGLLDKVKGIFGK